MTLWPDLNVVNLYLLLIKSVIKKVLAHFKNCSLKRNSKSSRIKDHDPLHTPGCYNCLRCKRLVDSQLFTYCRHQLCSHDPTWTCRRAHESVQLILRQKQHWWHTYTNIRGHDGRATSGGKPNISAYPVSPDEDCTKLHFYELKVEVTQSKILTLTYHQVSDGQSHKWTKLKIRKSIFLWPCYDWKYTSVWEFGLKDTPTFHHIFVPCSTKKKSIVKQQ